MKTIARKTPEDNSKKNGSPFFNSSNAHAFFKPSPIGIQAKPATAKPKAATWQDKLAGFNHDGSTEAEKKVFYKDLLEQEISTIFGKTEVVDVLSKDDPNCDPTHLTLMLEIGDGKLADYAPPDAEAEAAAKEKRLSVDLGKSKDVKSIEDPTIWCRRIFLNDIEKDNPQKFHAAYFHESKHDEHRQLYIKYFKKWKDKNKSSKKPKGFLTWFRENYSSKLPKTDFALIEEAHFSLTGTLFDESMAHLKTLEWIAAQTGTTDAAITSRFLIFGDYASNIADNVGPVIDAFAAVYKKLPEAHKKTIADIVQAQKVTGRDGVPKRIPDFYSKLAEKI